MSTSTSSTPHNIFWTSADGQGELDMSGDYDSADRAVAIHEAIAELLEQCGDEAHCSILSGRIDGRTVADWMAADD
ncbi:MAG: hypothetical protein ACOC00_00005 [Halothiobacillaceae bacterium]